MERLTLPESTGMPTVEEILERMDLPLTSEGEKLVRKAYEFAARAHEGQKRKSGDPYFQHCARVGWLLADLINDPSTIAAGLLHDTVEDCGVTVDQLAREFNKTVAELVDGVTKISSLNFSSDQEHQVQNLRKMILAMARDVRVVMIKLCDRLHNMQTLQHLSPERQRAIAQTTMDLYAPLANRLGMNRLRAQMEDLALKYLHPKQYNRLAKKIAVQQAAYQDIVDRTRKRLTEEFEKHGVKAEIHGRRKHLNSILQKMRHQGLRFDEVHDILAVRLITETVTECYEILGIVHSLWKPISGRFKDYIASPKENGYRSIHTVVIGVDNQVTEIQIRTHEMHRIAEEGIAAHWKYKESGTGKVNWGEEEKRLVWLRQLVDWLQDVHDPSEFMRDLKHDVFDTSIFVYTPKGEIIELPRGATVLDLAYRIHTELGSRTSGAKINNRMASIRTKLKTGDIVEILTSSTAHPTSDWLQIVQSGRARNKIRHWLKENQRQDFVEIGRRALMDNVRSRFGAGVDETQVLEILQPSLKNYRVDTPEDLMVEIGCGTIRVSSLLSRLEQLLTPPAPAKRAPTHLPRKRGQKSIVLVEGMAGAVVRMAQCCSPLPGEEIVGFITQGRGISVHRADCRALSHILERSNNQEGRLVSVQWAQSARSVHNISVRLLCQDRKGLLSDITSAIAQMNVNITGTESQTNPNDGKAVIRLTLLLEDSDQLNIISNRLTQIPGVHSVSRVGQAQRRAASGKTRS